MYLKKQKIIVFIAFFSILSSHQLSYNGCFNINNSVVSYNYCNNNSISENEAPNELSKLFTQTNLVWGDNNTFSGQFAQTNLVWGDNNTFSGQFAQTNLVWGDENIVSGQFAQTNLVWGDKNTFLGQFAQTNLIWGDENIVSGRSAQRNLIWGSGYIVKGANNIIIGNVENKEITNNNQIIIGKSVKFWSSTLLAFAGIVALNLLQ